MPRALTKRQAHAGTDDACPFRNLFLLPASVTCFGTWHGGTSKCDDGWNCTTRLPLPRRARRRLRRNRGLEITTTAVRADTLTHGFRTRILMRQSRTTYTLACFSTAVAAVKVQHNHTALLSALPPIFPSPLLTPSLPPGMHRSLRHQSNLPHNILVPLHAKRVFGVSGRERAITRPMYVREQPSPRTQKKQREVCSFATPC